MSNPTTHPDARITRAYSDAYGLAIRVGYSQAAAREYARAAAQRVARAEGPHEVRACMVNTQTMWRTDVLTDRSGAGWVEVTNVETGEHMYFDFDSCNEKCRSEGQARAQARAWVESRGRAR